jgi:hypothetical protein
MKVLKIIVDELPKCCEECDLLNCSKVFPHEYCPVIDKEFNIYSDCEDIRHKDCKLKVVKTNK